MATLLVRSERVVLPGGERAATVRIRDGRITGVGDYRDSAGGTPLMDAGELVVMPGLVDTHVHINDPGRADWEGFSTATRAAAAGGITTLVDMPLNSIPPTITAVALEAKRRAATGKLHVDVGFWGGVVPGNAGELTGLASAGVRGFKCFLSPSGVDEFGHVAETDLREAMPILARLGHPLLVHAELPALLKAPDPAADPHRYSTWLHSRPPAAEQGAIELMLRLSREFATRVHIVHLASADALPSLATARQAGVAVSVETCPHYLTFCAEDVADGATPLKCAPPVREATHRQRLWKALADGGIDLVATDHSPAPPALKSIGEGNFLDAWGGIASLQVSLAAVWTGAHQRDLPMTAVSRWMAWAPAELAGLARSKGAIAEGRDADLVFFDPDREWVIDASALYHRHPVTPYDGARLKGQVRKTMLRGEVIFDEGTCGPGAKGRLL